MLIGHLPAGYLMTRSLGITLAETRLIAAGLIGSILPDIDMIRFWFLDNRQYHHHAYWTHKPLVWLAIFLVCWLAARAVGVRLPGWVKLGFTGIALHMCLDSISGDIRWLWPFVNEGFHFVTVTATHSQWVLSFMAHWTFKLEVAVWVAALVLLGFDIRSRAEN
ncbi:MAG: metal-dependent hydrolase [Rhodobacteraceae bacterium]|nr:metal-dependent hydrolase [Paracoccaceae bacterium]